LSSERAYGVRLPKRPGKLSEESAGNHSVPETIEPPEPPEPSESKETYPKTQENTHCVPCDSEECVETEDPFDFPNDELILVHGYVNKVKARILIDTGTVLNHISLEFCQKNGIALHENDTHVGVMANKVEEKLKSTTSSVTISMGPYTEPMRLAASPLNYDIILGKNWCNNHNALVDCKANTVDFCYKGKKHTVSATEPIAVREVSINSICRDVKKGCPVFAIILDDDLKGENRNNDPSIKALLKKYKDVFPDNCQVDYRQNVHRVIFESF